MTHKRDFEKSRMVVGGMKPYLTRAPDGYDIILGQSLPAFHGKVSHVCG